MEVNREIFIVVIIMCASFWGNLVGNSLGWIYCPPALQLSTVLLMPLVFHPFTCMVLARPVAPGDKKGFLWGAVHRRLNQPAIEEIGYPIDVPVQEEGPSISSKLPKWTTALLSANHGSIV